MQKAINFRISSSQRDQSVSSSLLVDHKRYPLHALPLAGVVRKVCNILRQGLEGRA